MEIKKDGVYTVHLGTEEPFTVEVLSVDGDGAVFYDRDVEGTYFIDWNDLEFWVLGDPETGGLGLYRYKQLSV